MAWLAFPTVVVWCIAVWLLGSAFHLTGVGRKLRRLLAALVFTSLGVLLGALLIILQLFAAFMDETLVARVTTRRLSAEQFELTYTPANLPQAAQVVVQLEGDQWAVSGGVVKWRPWLTALGLKSYHRPMRLNGQFSRVEAQRLHLPTIYAFEPSIDRFWEALYWAAPHLPFIEAVYGSSAYVYVEPGLVQEIYVTPSGYLIQHKNRGSVLTQPNG